jgi:hypothetical protein
MVPAGFTAIPKGTLELPTGIVATTVLLEVSITETKPLSSATYARVPAEFTATPTGPRKTGIIATSVLVEVSMTETLPLFVLAMYARVPAGFTAQVGCITTGTVATTVLLAVSITKTLLVE